LKREEIEKAKEERERLKMVAKDAKM